MTTLQYVVSGGPDGDEHHEVEAPGEGALTLLVKHDDWLRLRAGELDVSVAYMQGRIKVTGDMGALIDLLPTIPMPLAPPVQDKA